MKPTKYKFKVTYVNMETGGERTKTFYFPVNRTAFLDRSSGNVIYFNDTEALRDIASNLAKMFRDSGFVVHDVEIHRMIRYKGKVRPSFTIRYNGI
jgi:hypothetical protein